MSLEKEGFAKLKTPEGGGGSGICLHPQRSAVQTGCRHPLLGRIPPLDQQIASDEFWQELRILAS